MAPRKEQKYIRNIRHIPVSIRFGDQHKGKRYLLQPRGERGDCAAVTDEDIGDPLFELNIGLIYEVINKAEVDKNIKKQTTNQKAMHPALSTIRSSTGEAYTKGVVINENINREGPNVASISDRGGITRYKTLGTVDQPFTNEGQVVQTETSAYLDNIARDKTLEGPEAGIGNLKVTKDEPRKEVV